MDVRIGMSNSSREISFETELSAAEVMSSIEKAAKDEQRFVVFEDVRDNQWHVNVQAIIFVEFGSATGRRVGFVN
ncbi:MAG TPA: DUF3107 domain-containing protein [Microbacteriaceae bacterium]|nr:DUF3107 domain-containing protein [Microbacteriaceae bacterium]